MGGIGKTATVLHWAHMRRESFVDGDLYIDLHGFDFRDPVPPATALVRFIRALGFPTSEIPQGLDDLASLFRTLVHHRRMLIFLDNARDASQVEPLLAAGEGLTTIITSRNRITSVDVGAPLRSITLPPLSVQESMTLLDELSGSGRFFQAPEALEELSRSCGFLPLALNLVGGRMAGRPHLAVSRLVDEIRNSHGGALLGALRSGAADTPHLDEIFAWSYHGLTARQATTFRLLGLPNAATISIDVARALTGASTVDDNIDSLVRASLVNEAEEDRFYLHDLLRTFARSRAMADETEETRSSAIRRMAAWYLGSSTAASNILMPERVLPRGLQADLADVKQFRVYETAMAWCERERTSFASAVHDAAQYGFHNLAWRMAVSMRGFYNIRKHWTEWESTHLVALDSAQADADVAGQAHVLNGLGTLMRQTHDASRAVAYHSQAYEIRLRLNDEFGAATALDGIGAALLDQGDFAGAIARFDEAYRLGLRIGSAHKQGWSLSNLGEAELARGDFEAARTYFRRSLDVRSTVADPWGEGRTRHFVGKVELDAGNYNQAADLLGDAAAFRRRIGDIWGTAWSLAGQSEANLNRQQWEIAVQLLGEAVALLESIRDPDADLLRLRLCSLTESGPDLVTPGFDHLGF